MTFGSESETSMSSMRPPMLAGPIDRNRKLERSGFWETLNVSRGGPPPPCASSSGGAAPAAPERRSRRSAWAMVSILVGVPTVRRPLSTGLALEPFGSLTLQTTSWAKSLQDPTDGATGRRAGVHDRGAYQTFPTFQTPPAYSACGCGPVIGMITPASKASHSFGW